jgi:hypothetical protein
MKKNIIKPLGYINSTTALILMISVFAFAGLPELSAQPEQIGGVSFYAIPGECINPEGNGSTYALKKTGDLQGCLYTFVESANCTSSGVYYERGVETFVGWYRGKPGTFRTTYNFEAKYQNCPNFVGEKVGRCQHPIVKGSGTGVFEGVNGRIDMKDDIQAGSFPYRGHLLW